MLPRSAIRACFLTQRTSPWAAFRAPGPSRPGRALRGPLAPEGNSWAISGKQGNQCPPGGVSGWLAPVLRPERTRRTPGGESRLGGRGSPGIPDRFIFRPAKRSWRRAGQGQKVTLMPSEAL